MANLIEVKIPNLGEAEDTEIIEISIKVGDSVSKNDPLIVLESEKAAMEVPSDYEGKVKEIKVKEGDNVSEGKVFATLEVNEAIKEEVVEEVVEVNHKQEKPAENKHIESKEPALSFKGVNAGPAVRKIARELSIDLSDILGTGKNKMVTKDDLKAYIGSLKDAISTRYTDLSALEEFGDYKLVNQTKIRTRGAINLYESWASIPHVTHFDEADITLLEQQRADLNKISAQKITPLSFVVKAVSMALEEYPIFNSSLVGKGKIMQRNYINLGIAVNTNEGLIVPVIKDANNLNVGQIALEIKALSNKAKNKKLFTKDLSGGTFTISSLGGIGGTGFTPIINPPEVGIMGVSKTKIQLSLIEGKIVEKTLLPFSVSYDHRVINGVDAGNFVNFIKETLEKGIT
jgi:pyruvate dehydrogenase E2 component (dihydrolipoamide acetyltransferase)